MSIRRRYEILLPLQFNDGRDVPDELLFQEAGLGAGVPEVALRR